MKVFQSKLLLLILIIIMMMKRKIFHQMKRIKLPTINNKLHKIKKVIQEGQEKTKRKN